MLIIRAHTLNCIIIGGIGSTSERKMFKTEKETRNQVHQSAHTRARTRTALCSLVRNFAYTAQRVGTLRCIWCYVVDVCNMYNVLFSTVEMQLNAT